MDKRSKAATKRTDAKAKKSDKTEGSIEGLDSKLLLWKEHAKELKQFDFLNPQLCSEYLTIQRSTSASNTQSDEEGLQGPGKLKNAVKYLSLIKYIDQHADSVELDAILHNIAFIYGVDKETLKTEALTKKKSIKKSPKSMPISEYLNHLIESDMKKAKLTKPGELEVILLPGLKVKATAVSKETEEKNETATNGKGNSLKAAPNGNGVAATEKKGKGKQAANGESAEQAQTKEVEISITSVENIGVPVKKSRGRQPKEAKTGTKLEEALQRQGEVSYPLRKKTKLNGGNAIEGNEMVVEEEEKENREQDKQPVKKEKAGKKDGEESRARGKNQSKTKKPNEDKSSNEEPRESLPEQYMEIHINNTVDDDDGDSFSFFYVNENLYNKTKHYFEKKLDPEEVCSCPGACNDPLICPCARANFENCGKTACYVYDSKYGKKRLLHQLIKRDMHIYECSANCACAKSMCLNSCVNEDTKNRFDVNDFIVERYKKVYTGQEPKLKDFFATMWGLKTNTFIPANTYVVEYCGEIITKKEGDKRGEKYDAINCNYLFDLNKHAEIEKVDDNVIYMNVDGVCETRSSNKLKDLKENFPLVIDAFFYGNHSRFVNHSCAPNMVALAVHIENRDILLPRIIYFALRDIQPGEELTIDYNCAPLKDLKNTEQLVCLCGAETCRGYVYEEAQDSDGEQ